MVLDEVELELETKLEVKLESMLESSFKSKLESRFESVVEYSVGFDGLRVDWGSDCDSPETNWEQLGDGNNVEKRQADKIEIWAWQGAQPGRANPMTFITFEGEVHRLHALPERSRR